jgi:membrane protease YdiL (CAAX protease family)
MKTTLIEDQLSKDVATFRDAHWKTQWLIIGLAVLILWRCIVFVNPKWLSQLPLWLSLISIGLFSVFLLLFPILTRNPHKHHSFGFPSETSCLREFGITIPVVIITIVFLSVANTLVGRISPETSLTPDIMKNIAVSPNHMCVYLFFLFSVTFVPIAEEIFFRGFLHNAFRARMPRIVAGLIQCLLFGFIHTFGAIHAVVAFVLGLVLTAVYEWRKTLITPIFVHAGINFMAFLSVILMMNAYSNGPAIGVHGDLTSTPCVIEKIAPNSAAEAADLHVGDIIVEFNGKPIRNIQDLIENVLRHNPGDKVPITINRAGTVFEVNVVLRKREKS